MSRLLDTQKELEQVSTIRDITAIFEAIASLRIAQIKDRVITSTKFFNEMWEIYVQLQKGEKHNIGSRATQKGSIALVIVTSDGGLIGDIDERIIHLLLKDERLSNADIFVVGGHGSTLLGQKHLTAKQVFTFPDVDKDFDVSPIAQVLSHYESATVFFQTYASLTRQGVAQMDLFSAVVAKGQNTKVEEVISSADYIFEPSIGEILKYMENTMLEVALAEMLLESRLAQYASRFNAMSSAKNKAKDMKSELTMDVHRIKRSISDERTKEIINSIKLRSH